jgi:hypothetical protein
VVDSNYYKRYFNFGVINDGCCPWELAGAKDIHTQLEDCKSDMIQQHRWCKFAKGGRCWHFVHLFYHCLGLYFGGTGSCMIQLNLREHLLIFTVYALPMVLTANR